MAKAKTTRKWVASYYTCYGTGYCNLQYLLRFQEPRFYTCGVYGWNCDIYTFGDYAITTGYRGMISHVDTQWELGKKYDDEARKILNDSSLNYEQKEQKVNKLLKDFLEKVFNDSVRVYGVA